MLTNVPIPKYATEVRFRGGARGIKIKFPFDRDLIDKVRTLPGRHYHDINNERFWTCPLTVDAVKQLSQWGFTIDKSLSDCLSDNVFQFTAPIKIEGLRGTLFPYENEAVAFIEFMKGRAILGDEQGLGKTIEAIGWLQLRRDLRPAVVVVQSSLKYMWDDKIREWMPNPRTQILSGVTPSEPIHGDIIIVNYEILAPRWNKKTRKEIPDTGWVNRLIAANPQVLIIDEIHNIMHSSARQTKAVLRLGRRCPFVVGIGGTLILNRPIEGYNAIKLINPTLVPPTKFEYGVRYCAGYRDEFGWQFNGASHIEELNQILRKVMIRRLKKDVLPQLPEKLRSIVPLEIENRKEYEFAEEDFIKWVLLNKGELSARRAMRAKALLKVATLKEIATRGKLPAALDWISTFLSSGKKLVVFTTRRQTHESILSAFRKVSVSLAGGMTSEDSHAVIRAFQKENWNRLLVGMLDERGRPAGVGHTLTAASSVAFIEFPWSPKICDQAEDRVHRFGQTSDSVNAYYLVALDTVEVKAAKLLDKKRKIIDALIDGTVTPEESLLTELLNEYMEGL